MKCKIYELGVLKQYKFVVILSEYKGKILLSRHRDRNTWETQGGHVEKGETPIEAAKRELFEESGAIVFQLEPLFDYWAGEEGSFALNNGMVFRAVIEELGSLPNSEMAETRQFDHLPENLTYPEITPYMFEHKKKLQLSRQKAVVAESPEKD